MTKNEIDHYLELFCRFVEAGKTPPEKLQKFIAEGIREFLADGKPWQIGPGGAPSRLSKWPKRKLAIQAAVLKEIKVKNHRIAAILNLTDTSGKDYGKKIRDYAGDGKAVIENPFSGEVECKWAADALMDSLTQSEQKSLSEFLARFDQDDHEPNYD